MTQSVGTSASGLCLAERYMFESRSTREFVSDRDSWRSSVIHLLRGQFYRMFNVQSKG